MPLFDRYLVVDWSAAGSPTTGADSIWIADIDAGSERSARRNCSTRAAAMQFISEQITASIRLGERLFVGLDFAFGYPHGASAAPFLDGWKAVWKRLAADIEDDGENRNNRFDLANRLNETFGATGPFWGHPHGRSYDHLDSRSERAAASGVEPKRRVDKRQSGAQSVWKLAYTGSVGSQSLVGIPHLEKLRETFGERLAVWPFETDFERVLDADIVVAEIYPSLFAPKAADGWVKDEWQVAVLAHLFERLDRADRFDALLAAPDDLGADDREIVLSHEGWIVGVEASGQDDAERLLPDVVADLSRGATVEGGSEPYIRIPSEIYANSFAIVEAEADLARFGAAERQVAILLVHSCGMVDVVDDMAFSTGAAEAGAAALRGGADIICDVEMVRHGIIGARLPAGNDVLCGLNDQGAMGAAERLESTRSAGGIEVLRERLPGSVVVIGNAPTALYRVLELIEDGVASPALIVGIPVGFVGAVESKQALAAHTSGVPFITVHGRRGGSAMAASVVNALAGIGSDD